MLARHFTAALFAATCLAGSAQALTITPGVEYTSASTLSDSRPFTLGYAFSLSAATSINALGYWDNGRGSTHQVGIWDSVGTLLGSTTVTGSSPIVGHFAWSAVSLTLAPGSYVIGGEFLGDGTFNSFATGITSIPAYTYLGDRQISGSGLNFPTVNTGGGYGENGIFEVSFSVGNAVPEPATWGLMLTGFGLVGAAARRRSRVTA